MRLPSFKRPLHSFKDFFKEYLLIVLGVVTALAANAWITRDQHAQAAAGSTASMDVELQASLESIRGSLKKNQAEIQQLGLLGKLIADDLRYGVPAKTINADIASHRAQFQAGAYFPDTPSKALQSSRWTIPGSPISRRIWVKGAKWTRSRCCIPLNSCGWRCAPPMATLHRSRAILKLRCASLGDGCHAPDAGGLEM